MKYEYLYKTYNTVSKTQTAIADLLNEFGTEGWEVVSMANSGNDVTFTLKRAVEEDEHLTARMVQDPSGKVMVKRGGQTIGRQG